MMGIKTGDIIQSPRWPEPIEVKLIEDGGEYIRVVGATIHSQEHIDQLIPQDEFAHLSAAVVDPNFSAQPRQVFFSFFLEEEIFIRVEGAISFRITQSGSEMNLYELKTGDEIVYTVPSHKISQPHLED